MWARWLIASLSICWLPTAGGQEGAGNIEGGFAENLILITIDGLRPEEFFGGADPRLFLEDLGVKDPQKLQAEYCRDTREASRKALMPFLWETIEQGGWTAGDWTLDSKVQVTNGHYFSYPGYSEILCGFADNRIDSNDKKYNPNQTFLEWLHRREAFSNRVMAFTSWDVFPYIINDRRSDIPVNAGWQPLELGEPQALDAYNYVADNVFHEWEGVRYDAFTTAGALQAMRAKQPRVLFVSLGEPDDWAHAGRYDRYLLTAKQNDYFIRQLWEQAEAMPAYAGKTTFLITTDHGRGDGREGWKSHGTSYPGSDRIWVVAFGKGLSRRGIDRGGDYQQAQVAASAAAFLGLDYTRANPKVAKPLPCAPSRSK
ncbi:hypothetical protein SH139x_003393 [Planctomycetaceae bacterium SH139]